MARFNTRVELHYATAQHYKSLSEAMINKGFTGYVIGSNGKYYELPPGEYAYEGNKTSDQVRELATQAASTTGKNFAIRVTEGDSCWSGLKEISAPAKSFSSYY
jgi:hydroxymethylpyrimidine pyrophosphatase-like HAD family hydrolase